MLFLTKSQHVGLLYWRPFLILRTLSSSIGNDKSILTLCKHLKISETNAQYICIKHPIIKKLDECNLKSVIDTLFDLGFTKQALVKEPSVFSILPITLKFRFKVLQECGIKNISLSHLLSYLTIIKQKTIRELKESGEIAATINIENRLASYMTQWPTSLTTIIYGDINTYTMYSLRLKIIQRYLELLLDLSEEEFQRGIETYPTIKHRPLQTINKTFNMLQSIVMMPSYKIKSNLYLIHVDPDNLEDIIYKFKSIGGIDIKEVLRMHPKIATRSYLSLMETRDILKEYNISNEAQVRCFEIYTLAPSTVRERLEKAKKIPEVKMFFDHERFLKIVHYKTRVMKRLAKLYNNNKKCVSLNILSGSAMHYEAFEKSSGDRLGKSKDLVFCIKQSLGNNYKSKDIRKMIKRHPYWINTCLIQLKYVYQQLSSEFSPNDIYDNCPLLLYPWTKIRNVINYLQANPENIIPFHNHVDVNKLTKSQKLSLTLYLLEKNYYFSGNGIWTEDIVNGNNEK